MGVRALEIRTVYAMRFLARFLCGVLAGGPIRGGAVVRSAALRRNGAQPRVACWVDAPLLNLASLIFKTITAGGQNQGQSRKRKKSTILPATSEPVGLS